MEMAPIRPPHDKFLKKTKHKSFNGVSEVRDAMGGGSGGVGCGGVVVAVIMSSALYSIMEQG